MTETHPNTGVFYTLPLEIIYQVMEFIEPEQLGRLSCTCRRALELVNAKLVAKYVFLSPMPGTEISMSGQYIRLMRQYEKEMCSSDGCYTEFYIYRYSNILPAPVTCCAASRAVELQQCAVVGATDGVIVNRNSSPTAATPLTFTFSAFLGDPQTGPEISFDMKYSHIAANDGCKLAFQSSLPLGSASLKKDPRYNTLALLIHGFSGSSLYFQRNFDALSASSWVIALDLRGHGESGRPRGGYHVARLAADLKELVSHIKSIVPDAKIIPVGCSIGAAVLWTYVELFSDSDFGGMVFVDQAPLQDRSRFGDWDESKAHYGCFDAKSLSIAQAAWTEDPEGTFKGLVADCLGYRFKPRSGDDVSEEQKRHDEDFFTSQSRRCDTTWLARLIADHTSYDHREACELIKVPVLVIAGERTGCFPLEGIKETVRRVEKGRRDIGTVDYVLKWSVFDSGHWMFWEEPDRFNKEIGDFVAISTK